MSAFFTDNCSAQVRRASARPNLSPPPGLLPPFVVLSAGTVTAVQLLQHLCQLEQTCTISSRRACCVSSIGVPREATGVPREACLRAVGDSRRCRRGEPAPEAFDGDVGERSRHRRTDDNQGKDDPDVRGGAIPLY